MAEYVIYVPQQRTHVDGERPDGTPKLVVDETFDVGDDVTQEDLDWTDEQWIDAIRRGKIVLKGSSDDPNTMLYEPGAVGLASMQAEAVALNASTVAADPNVDLDAEGARAETGGHFVDDRTPLVETEMALEAEHGVLPRGSQRTVVTSSSDVSSGTRTVINPGATQEVPEGSTDKGDEENDDDKSSSTSAKAAPAKATPAKATPAAPAKSTPPKSS
jgi:hypothetical protein